MDPLRFAIFQFGPRLGDAPANVERIAAAGGAASADVLVTPELSLTGYDLGDRAVHLGVPVRKGEAIPGCDRLAASKAVIIAGLAELGDDDVTYNALVALKDGIVQHKHRKVYLPTYGMFDEGRFWGRGRHIEPWSYEGWRLGLLVCEDFWHPGLVYALSQRNIQILVVAAAAPGRGLRGAADSRGTGRFASSDAWTRIARATAQLYGIHVVLANRVGVEGGVTFAGGSVAVAPDGTLLAEAGNEEAELRFEVSRSDLRRARRPFVHARDDDAGLVVRALMDRPAETPA